MTYSFPTRRSSDLEVALAILVELVVEAGIAAAHRLQPVVEVEHHLVQRQPVDQHRPAADIGEVELLAAPLGTELQDRPEILVGHHDRGLDPGLGDRDDPRDRTSTRLNSSPSCATRLPPYS